MKSLNKILNIMFTTSIILSMTGCFKNEPPKEKIVAALQKGLIDEYVFDKTGLKLDDVKYTAAETSPNNWEITFEAKIKYLNNRYESLGTATDYSSPKLESWEYITMIAPAGSTKIKTNKFYMTEAGKGNWKSNLSTNINAGEVYGKTMEEVLAKNTEGNKRFKNNPYKPTFVNGNIKQAILDSSATEIKDFETATRKINPSEADKIISELKNIISSKTANSTTAK